MSTKSTRAGKAQSRCPAQAQPVLNELDYIKEELLKLVAHFRLADQKLYDLQDVPEELQSAAIVLHHATNALDALYDRLDEPEWRTRLQAACSVQ